MKSRLWICLLMALLALSVLPAAAQDDGDSELDFATLNCLGLSDEDCALVTTSVENIETIESFTLDFSFSQSTGNTEGMAMMGGMGLGGPTDVQGTATISVDKDAMSEDDPMAGISMAMSVTSTVTIEDEVVTVTNNIVIVDGNLYIQNEDTGEWTGTNLEELAEHAEDLETAGVPSISFMGMPMSMDDMMGMGAGAMSGGDFDDMENLLGDFDLEDVLTIPGFLSQSRLADETTGGHTDAVFAYTADLGVLFGDESVRNAIGTAMAGMSGAGGDNPMGAQLAAMMPVLLENTTGTITLTRWIGTDDSLPHGLNFDVQAAIDLFGGASGTNTPVPPITISLTVDLRLSDINSTPAPTAPEGATLVPAEEFIGQGELTPEATP